MRTRRTRKTVCRLGANMALFVAMTGASAHAPAGGGTVVEETDCTAVIARPEVPPTNVRDLVPHGFELETTPGGRVPVGPVMVHCREISVNGGLPRETVWAALRIGLSPDEGSLKGHQPLSQLPVHDPLHGDDYQLFIASNNPEVVDVFRREAGASARQAVYVKDLVFDLRDDGTFSFQAPAPTPSPFRIVDAQVGPRALGPIEVSVHHWGTGRRGLWRLGGSDGGPDRLAGLHAGYARGRVYAEPRSEMAMIFSGTDGSFNDPIAGTVSFPAGEWSVEVADQSE